MSIAQKILGAPQKPAEPVAEIPETPTDNDRLDDARRMLDNGLSARRAANESGAPLDDVKALEDAKIEAEGRPAGLPANFRTVDALAASYKEAERKIREQGEQIKQLRAELDERPPADPEMIRAEFHQHRAAFFTELRAEAERLLAIDGRLTLAEQNALSALEGTPHE